MIVYRCEDSLESIFTAIYLVYEEHRDIEDTILVLHDEMMLFAENVSFQPDTEKVEKVIRSLIRRFGEPDYYSICMALAADDADKAQAVFRTIARGLKMNTRPGHLFDAMADANVYKAFALSRNAGREYHHLQGFVRFQELQGKMLYSVIGPQNNLVVFLLPFFADRLPNENFVIYDENRKLFGIHPAGKEGYLFTGSLENSDTAEIGDEEGTRAELLEVTAEERLYSSLFTSFCKTIAIKERYNPKLQMNMLPKRFQKFMTEFREKV